MRDDLKELPDRRHGGENRHTALVAALEVLEQQMRKPTAMFTAYWADRLAAELAKHRAAAPEEK